MPVGPVAIIIDYYELHRTPIRAPLAGNRGFIEVEPGRPYTLSICMKAFAVNTPARLAVRQFQGRSFEQPIRVSTDSQRYALSFAPTSRWCYVRASALQSPPVWHGVGKQREIGVRFAGLD